MPSTVALRFRDFGVKTVDEHNAIAHEKGSVWWGWWNKPEERPPRDLLESFVARISEEEGVEVFLVDSGTSRLYSTRLVEIAVTGLGEETITPEESDLIPDYYRERPWKVWFRIKAIQEEDVARIRAFSYQELPGDALVEDPNADAYDGKRVHSLQEMLDRRHRTMYFLRPRREGDREAEVQLVAPDHPEPFATIARSVPSSYVLVLSDLHFSEANHEFALVGEVGNPDLFTILDSEIRTQLGGKPAAVLLAGDLTWEGSQNEFEIARTLVSTLQSVWDLHWSQVLAIPGNHDITWLSNGGQAGQPSGAQAEANYRAFVSQAFKFPSPDHLCMGRRLLLDNFVPVDLVAVNSCRLESEEYRGYGYVGADQLRYAFEQMGWTPGPDPGPRFRVLALHHHVVPVTPVEKLGAENYSLTLDAGQLLFMALEYGVDIIVHGHQHQPFAGGISRMVAGGPFTPTRLLPIHGVGSVGVERSHLGTIGRNAYSILRFEPDGVSVTVRARSEQVGHGFDDYWDYKLERTTDGLRATVP